jgi:Protein of unknown function (DUF2630)
MDEHRILNQISVRADRAQPAAPEGALDRCWDQLGQRRARRESGQDDEDVQVRSVEQVENYRP